MNIPSTKRQNQRCIWKKNWFSFCGLSPQDPHQPTRASPLVLHWETLSLVLHPYCGTILKLTQALTRGRTDHFSGVFIPVTSNFDFYLKVRTWPRKRQDETPCQTSTSKVISCKSHSPNTHTHTHTHNRHIALYGPLNWSEITAQRTPVMLRQVPPL